MHDFVAKVREIRGVVIRIRVFYFILDAFSLLLFSILLSLLFGLPLPYAIAPVLFYAAWVLWKKLDVLEELAARYDYLGKRLRAAYDNREEDNLVMRHLSAEVSAGLSKVRYSSFLSHRKALIRVLTPVVLSFAIVSTAFADIESLTVSLPMLQLREAPEAGLISPGDMGAREILRGNVSSILGNASVARIEGREVELELHPMGGELRVRRWEEEKRFAGSPEGVPELEPSGDLPESIPEKYEEVIRGYFEKLAARG